MKVITRKADYATRVLLHLSMLPPGSWTTAQEVARRWLIPDRLIRHVISQLAKADLLVTKRGRGGGMRMARPASEISLLDVLEAIQGPFSLNVCIEDPGGCQLMPECPTYEAWLRAQDVLVRHLRHETLDKLAQRGETLAAS